MTAIADPLWTIPLAGTSCNRCGCPAHHVAVYREGRITVHMDPRKRPCPAPNPPARDETKIREGA